MNHLETPDSSVCGCCRIPYSERRPFDSLYSCCSECANEASYEALPCNHGGAADMAEAWIRAIAAACGDSGDMYIEQAESWILNHYGVAK